MVVCFACGAELVPSLEDAGSLRCHDCRDDGAPLLPALVSLDGRRSGRPERPRRTDRPALTLIRTLPVRPTSTYDPPPLAA